MKPEEHPAYFVGAYTDGKEHVEAIAKAKEKEENEAE